MVNKIEVPGIQVSKIEVSQQERLDGLTSGFSLFGGTKEEHKLFEVRTDFRLVEATLRSMPKPPQSVAWGRLLQNLDFVPGVARIMGITVTPGSVKVGTPQMTGEVRKAISSGANSFVWGGDDICRNILVAVGTTKEKSMSRMEKFIDELDWARIRANRIPGGRFF